MRNTTRRICLTASVIAAFFKSVSRPQRAKAAAPGPSRPERMPAGVFLALLLLLTSFLAAEIRSNQAKSGGRGTSPSGGSSQAAGGAGGGRGAGAAAAPLKSRDAPSLVAGAEPGGRAASNAISAAQWQAGFLWAQADRLPAGAFPAAPAGAAPPANWAGYGVSERVTLLPETGWPFRFGTGAVGRVYATSFGALLFSYGVSSPVPPAGGVPDGTGLDFAAPLQTVMGVTPPDGSFRYASGADSATFTWGGVHLGRDTNCAATVQAEFYAGGDFTFRYHFPGPAEDYARLTNAFLIGAQRGPGGETVLRTNTLAAIDPGLLPAFELRWKSLAGLDPAEADHDGDGLSTADEFYKYRTDPRTGDTDADGLGDGEEVFTFGTDPLRRDTDGDGLVDGSDPDPLNTTSLADHDGDGIPDAYEIHWFGGTNLVDSPSVSYTDTGFSVGVQLLAGMNPASPAPAAVSPADTLVSRNLFGPFACDFGQPRTNVIYERAFTVDRHGGWRQYFISARPDRAEPWSLEGMTLEWEEEGGTNGAATASPPGDSLRLALAGEGPATLTLRLRADGGASVRSARPLHLLAWSPGVTFDPPPRAGGTNGFQCLAFLTADGGRAEAAFDRAARPHNAPAPPEELAAAPFMTGGGLSFDPRTDGTGGTLRAPPGVYGAPGAILSPTNAAPVKLIFATPRLSFDACGGGCGMRLSYDADTGAYSRVHDYPLDSRRLREGWRRDAAGAWLCSCEPEFTLGAASLADWLAYTVTRDGDHAAAAVSLGAARIWEDEAWHGRRDACGDAGGRDLTGDGCGGCGGCAEGDCDAYEGDSPAPLAFRVPLGIPRRGQVSGFLWFRSDGPVTVTPALFNVLLRADASASVTSNNNAVARVVCAGGRGRDVTVTAVAHGARIAVTDLLEGALDSTWEVTNPGGDPSRVSFRRVTRLGNPLRDVDYRYESGAWTRTDNISRTVEQLAVTGDVNSDDLREERTVRDLSGAVISREAVEYRRAGTGDNAVLRETGRLTPDSGGGLSRYDFCTYWTDDLHAARNGRPKLMGGDTRPWSYQVWDAEGREILRAEQRDGSGCHLNGEPLTLQPLLAACTGASTVTETSYAPLPGDSDHAEDKDRPRTVSVWAAGGGAGTLIARMWHVYTRVTAGGMPAVLRRTVRAASASAAMDGGLNAVSEETAYAGNDPGVPLLLRGRAASSTDEAGVTTSYSYAFGAFDPSTRTFTEGGPTNHVRIVRSVAGALTRTLTVEDAVHGLELHSATLPASDGSALEWESRAYDGRGRLRFTAFHDGTSATNHYSCCRLLWSRDREGRTVHREAVTGYDHLHYATEERSVSNLTGSAAWPVTRRWFDALGRETNTVTASSDGLLSGGGRSAAYPSGSSDHRVETDARGGVTVTTAGRNRWYEQTVTGQYAPGAGSPHLVTTVTRWRNGPVITRREWDGKFTEETRAATYDANGCRAETVTRRASDIAGAVTVSVTTFDFLGRTASVSTPLGATAYTYATDRSRLVYTERTGGPAAERTDYHYDDAGEQIGVTVSHGAGLPASSSFTVTSYEAVSNGTWRVTRTSRLTDGVTNSVVTAMEQLTGLGAGVVARSVAVGADGAVTATETALDPDTHLRTVTAVTDGMTPHVRTSRYGYALASSGLDGSESVAYDALGRESARTLRDRSDTLLGTVAVSYDGFGNVAANAVTYGQASTPDVVTVTGYDSSGRALTAATSVRGEPVSAVTNAYDSAGMPVARGGDAYPVAFGHDTAGRRVSLATKYGAADADAVTQWRFDAVTGLLTNKLDAAGRGASHTYTADGRPLRTAWARPGAWKESVYDARGLVRSNRYSSSSMDVAFAYDAAGLPALVTGAAGFSAAYAYSDALVLTNEALGGLGGSLLEIRRAADSRQRPSVMTLARDGTDVSQVAYGYDVENRLATISATNAQGRGFSLAYSYNGSYGTGCTLTTPTNAVIGAALTRDPYRRRQVTDVVTAFNGLEITAHSYAFDGLGRVTNAVRSIRPLALASTNAYAYNARSEVVGALIETNDYAYIYDSLGNNLYTSLNAVTNAYTVNNLNQYTSISNFVSFAPSCEIHPHYDADGNMVRLGNHILTYDAENRLSAYTFGIGSSTGMLRSAYVYDHLGRRISKMDQESKVKNPGGIVPLTYWHTNTVTAFVYDGWNLVYERVAHTNGTIQETTYFWGKDLSGTLQGAGGVGGLLAVSIGGDFLFPCYDNNGNITAYIDEGGTVVAYRKYDAFGNTIAKGGDMVDVLHFWFSTKYLDHDTGLYYYGYRYYSSLLQRWINRDPIGERGGVNMYGFCENNPVSFMDIFGLWKKGETIDYGARRVYYCDSAYDTMASLAKIVGLEADESSRWAEFYNNPNRENACGYSVPNVWVSADLLRGGGLYSRLINMGGTLGVFVGTDIFTSSDYKIEKAQTVDELISILERNKGDVWGMTVFGHGSYPDGRVLLQSGLNRNDIINGQNINWIYQEDLIRYVAGNGYKLAKIYMMQCYSAKVSSRYDWKSKWEEHAKIFFGYKGMNSLLLDGGWGIWPWNWF